MLTLNFSYIDGASIKKKIENRSLQIILFQGCFRDIGCNLVIYVLFIIWGCWSLDTPYKTLVILPNILHEKSNTIVMWPFPSYVFSDFTSLWFWKCFILCIANALLASQKPSQDQEYHSCIVTPISELFFFQYIICVHVLIVFSFCCGVVFLAINVPY